MNDENEILIELREINRTMTIVSVTLIAVAVVSFLILVAVVTFGV
ncbi:MAG: hypothetical protein ACXV5H_00995 [Halobacteriota archaeon]